MVLEVPIGKMVDEFLHEGENICVIGGGRQYQLAVAERILHSFCHIAAGQVMHHDLGAALFLQLLCQQLHRCPGVPIHGGIGDDNTLALHPIG